jgi:hypothetical protein
VTSVLPEIFFPVSVPKSIDIMFTIVILAITGFAPGYKNVRIAAIFSLTLVSSRIFLSITSVSSRDFPGRNRQTDTAGNSEPQDPDDCVKFCR